MSTNSRKRRKQEDIEDMENTKDDTEMMSKDEDQDSDDVEDSEGDDSEDKEFINKEVDIEFSAYPPISDDFNGVKCLLSQVWLKENVNISELTQLLIDQNSICSVLKQEVDEREESDSDDDDDDVYGVTSVIPLAKYSSKDCIKQIINCLLTHSPKDNQINKILSNNKSKIGLIVNERFANLPPKISLPLYQQLVTELKTSNKSELDFEWYLMISKLLKTRPKNKKTSDNSEVIYVNAEEELFDELSDDSYEYSVANQCDSDVFDWKDDQNLYEPIRKIILLSNQNWIKAIDKLTEELK